MAKLSDDGVARYNQRITDALNDPSINGWEMEFLSDMMEKFIKQGDKMSLTQKQWHRLESVLQKTEPIDPF